MLKKNITYNNFDGVPVTEEFCFHLMESDFIDLDFKYEEYGGLKEYLKSLIKDIQERGESAPKRPMYEFLKEIIELAVGKKVGVRFDRSQDAKDRFFQTGAYSTFIMELLSQPDGIVDFLNAITPAVPEDKRKEAVAQLEAEGIHVLPQPDGN